MQLELMFIRSLMKMTVMNKLKNTKFKNNKLLYQKIAVSVVAAVFLVLLYAMIFSFSEQDGEASGGLSRKISEHCVEIANVLSGREWSQEKMDYLAELYEYPIRKLAHFGEYACMGVLVYTLWRPWKARNKKLFLLVTIWVAVSAAGDECHQLFVPGRYGSFADVLLDTCGGVFGILCCWLLEKWLQIPGFVDRR